MLRDGSTATVRPATAADADAMRRFFHELSPESRRRRFFAAGEPPAAIVDRLCASADPSQALTLVVERDLGGERVLIAVGSYFADARPGAEPAAEVAFAVDDRFQGKGLGTLLLERLAVAAAASGFTRFAATTLADNARMLEVFRDSGFAIRSKSAGGTIDLQLSLTPSFESVASAEERRRLATAASLRPMLEPQSVAVVGASRDTGAIGRRVLDALSANGFGGRIYPINPRGGTIAGLTAYRSLREVPEAVDLAVIAVPRDAVLPVIDDCAANGTRSTVVITAGFAEAGAEGRALQDTLTAKVRGAGMRMVGPNCMGLLNANPGVRLNASFSPIFPPAGRLSMSSQSGALGMAILKLAADRGLGLSTFVSVGNKADVSSNDLLEYWEGDQTTSVMLLYLESFGNPRRFARLARRIGRRKPIVVVKAGRTRAGSRAAGSHTAALAASDVAVDALFRQTGVMRATTIDEMFDVAACLDAQPLPAGRRVAIVTNAGGPGILAVDACEAAGLSVVEFTPATRAQLAAFLPANASLGNPVDMIATAGGGEYRRAVEVALRAAEADALIVIYTPVDPAHSGEVIAGIRDGVAAARAAGASTRPVVACLMADQGEPPLVVGRERVPTYTFPENAARALAAAAAYAAWREQPAGLFWGFDDVQSGEARAIVERALAERGDGWLTTEETRGVLGAFRLPLAGGTIVRSADDAAAAAAALGYPVVAKLSSRQIQHKTEAGGVRLRLANETEVRQAFIDILDAARSIAPLEPGDGVLVQPMIAGGVETMIGVADDPLFGPLVGFGLGGVNVEILGDVRFRVAPLTDRDADELLHEIRGFPLLAGHRGHPPADLDALRDVLLRVSKLAEEVPEISELDLNPVIALPPGEGCRIVDARIRVRGKSVTKR